MAHRYGSFPAVTESVLVRTSHARSPAERRLPPPALGMKPEPSTSRALAIGALVLLHATCYYLVNLVNGRRPLREYVDLTVVVDGWIPYLGWTWVPYYIGDLYITVWAAYVFWRIPRRMLQRTVVAYAGAILFGATVQILVPAVAPWPSHLTPVQRWIHELIAMRPHACLPSMHVALTVIPACIAFRVLEARWLKIASAVVAVAITLSTLTLKEHYFLDTLTGFLLGLTAYVYWRGSAHSDALRPIGVSRDVPRA